MGAKTLQNQLSRKPPRLIGAESIVMALWLALYLGPEIPPYLRSSYRAINEETALRALEGLKSLSPRQMRYYYPVASAVSFDTAFDAGVVFASHGMKWISMGFGAYMADENFAPGGQNPWALQDIMTSLNHHSTSRQDLAGPMGAIVTAYRANTSSDRFAKSIRMAQYLARPSSAEES